MSTRKPQDEGPDAPPTEEELEAARLLRDALDGAEASTEPRSGRPPLEPSGNAALALALRNAWEPAPIEPAAHAAIVERALREAAARRRGKVIRLGAVVSTALALAAGVALFVQAPSRGPAPPPLVHSRSTQPLFRERFGLDDSTARIDRIAAARSADLRENRFARWGVR